MKRLNNAMRDAIVGARLYLRVDGRLGREIHTTPAVFERLAERGLAISFHEGTARLTPSGMDLRADLVTKLDGDAQRQFANRDQADQARFDAIRDFMPSGAAIRAVLPCLDEDNVATLPNCPLRPQRAG